MGLPSSGQALIPDSRHTQKRPEVFTSSLFAFSLVTRDGRERLRYQPPAIFATSLAKSGVVGFSMPSPTWKRAKRLRVTSVPASG